MPLVRNLYTSRLTMPQVREPYIFKMCEFLYPTEKSIWIFVHCRSWHNKCSGSSQWAVKVSTWWKAPKSCGRHFHCRVTSDCKDYDNKKRINWVNNAKNINTKYPLSMHDSYIKYIRSASDASFSIHKCLYWTRPFIFCLLICASMLYSVGLVKDVHNTENNFHLVLSIKGFWMKILYT